MDVDDGRALAFGMELQEHGDDGDNEDNDDPETRVGMGSRYRLDAENERDQGLGSVLAFSPLADHEPNIRAKLENMHFRARFQLYIKMARHPWIM